MSVIPDKKDYKNADRSKVATFTNKLAGSGFELAMHVAPTEKSHFDRFGFVKNNKRVVIVYDVKASILSVTASDEQFREVCGMWEKLARSDSANTESTSVPKSGKKSPELGLPEVTKPSQGKAAKQTPKNKQEKQPQPNKSDKQSQQDKSAKQANKGAKTDASAGKANAPKSPVNNAKNVAKNERAAAKPSQLSLAENKSAKKNSAKTTDAKASKRNSEKVVGSEKANQPQKQSAPTEHASDNGDEPLKNDFSLKKYTAERFDAALQSLKNVKVKYKLKSRQGSGVASVDVYEVSDGKNKLTVTYMPEKQILQIQGKATDFSRKVQTYFSEGSDYKSAVKAHIEQKQTDEKAADVEKRLKKYLPVASVLLSQQAKIDFSIGIVDLLSGNIVLSDYSSLLIPPYRGLEKLIFDLEQAQGIKVKMVGQAYEKDENGAYVLKSVYRKRIGSIVYAEVMAALYTEYNSTRNYYVHSGPQMQNKVINDKNQAISIYENMLAVVEYNAKKLREIGFTMKKQ